MKKFYMEVVSMMESYTNNEVLQDSIMGFNRIFKKYNTNFANEIEKWLKKEEVLLL